jgi:hypothetical protein
VADKDMSITDIQKAILRANPGMDLGEALQLAREQRYGPSTPPAEPTAPLTVGGRGMDR